MLYVAEKSPDISVVVLHKLILKVVGVIRRASVSSKAHQRIHKVNIHDQNMNLTDRKSVV